ncbi:MAG: hypothetical protein Q9164_007460, partial [Protoblastenia rupestris]
MHLYNCYPALLLLLQLLSLQAGQSQAEDSVASSPDDPKIILARDPIAQGPEFTIRRWSTRAKSTSAKVATSEKKAPKPTTTKRTPRPGSTGKATSVPATKANPIPTKATPTTPPANSPVVTPTSAKEKTTAAPATTTPPTEAAAAAQIAKLKSILSAFVKGCNTWAINVTQPAVKTKAVNEITDLRNETETIIKNLGGIVPPATNNCSGKGQAKSFNLTEAVETQSNSPLSLANCVDIIIIEVLMAI